MPPAEPQDSTQQPGLSPSRRPSTSHSPCECQAVGRQGNHADQPKELSDAEGVALLHHYAPPFRGVRGSAETRPGTLIPPFCMNYSLMCRFGSRTPRLSGPQFGSQGFPMPSFDSREACFGTPRTAGLAVSATPPSLVAPLLPCRKSQGPEREARFSASGSTYSGRSSRHVNYAMGPRGA
jgi:hypothetical protein